MELGTVAPFNGTELPLAFFVYSCVVASSLFVSSIFPFATFVIYAVLPQLHDVHGLSVMSYVASTFISYVLYGILDLITMHKPNGAYMCVGLGHLVHYFALCVYSWMGVLCFDTFSTLAFGSSEDSETRRNTTEEDFGWPSVGSTETSDPTRENNGVPEAARAKQRSRFLKYCVSGWGIPLIVVAIGQILEYVEGLPNWIVVPGLGVNSSCWFRADIESLVYLTLPSVLLWIVSLVLIIRANRSFSTYNDSFRKNTAPRIRAIKCALAILGITGSFETIADISYHVWSITSVLYVIQAVLLFAVFVIYQRRVLCLLYRRSLPLLLAWRRTVPAVMGCSCCDAMPRFNQNKPDRLSASSPC